MTSWSAAIAMTALATTTAAAAWFTWQVGRITTPRNDRSTL